ncbi:hypothetical protein MTR_6g053470 [Medicago truncatula]|uniref:Uncharacterized protein n=1 Tax=Medicago truncatula TaxID=3880 RepID=A0A072UBG2_MEDTR|nr:hypothetical protein MTR_6g053470 [Medicago truncatula]
MRLLGRSNLVGRQAAPADRTVIPTCGVYTNLVDLGHSSHTLLPLDSSTNGKLYQRLPYQEVEDNGLIRFTPPGVCFSY